MKTDDIFSRLIRSRHHIKDLFQGHPGAVIYLAVAAAGLQQLRIHK